MSPVWLVTCSPPPAPPFAPPPFPPPFGPPPEPPPAPPFEFPIAAPPDPPVTRATCTEATPPVASPMPVSLASNPAILQGSQTASLSWWRQNV